MINANNRNENKAANRDYDARYDYFVKKAVNQKLAEDIAQISKFDSSIKSVSDLEKDADYPRMLEYAERGLSIVDAYKLVKFDTLIKDAETRGGRSTAQSIGNRTHLKKTTVRADDGIDIPSEVLEEYRVLCPDISIAELKKHYGKYSGK